MKYSKLSLFATLGLALAGPPLQAQTSKPRSHPGFTEGPAKVQLEKLAQLEVPAGYMFVDGKTYRALLKKEGEPVSGQELGMLVSTNDDLSVVFSFSAEGYVKDDDKDKLDPDKLLDTIRRGTAEANKTRVKAGHPPIEVVGWDVPPKYDSTTHNLEWAIRGAVEGQPLLNYDTRLLGRKGVMQVALIVEPDKLAATMPAFRSLLDGFSFQTGQAYAEYRPGDKVAKYGLAALVVGGGAVAAAKLGMLAWLAVLLKKAWKLVVLAFAAVAAFFKRLFSGRGARPQGR
jgi:uncharacterized membrane-anchored protein